MIAYFLNLEQRYIWGHDYSDAPHWLRALVHVARMLALLTRDLVDGDLTMRAMSLVYTTLLSLVPLLALSFSILKGFGVQNMLDDTLRGALTPLGEAKALELTETIIGFVDNMSVGVLGSVGLLFLVYTVVSLMQKIERSFNHVWHIRVSRTFGERFTTFLSAITIGPLLIVSAIAMTGSVMNTAFMNYLQSITVIGMTIDVAIRLVPFVLIITAFTFLYMFIPNTRVRLGAALVGGVVAGVLWETLSFGFAAFAAGASNYQAVYASFASIVLFLIWLYFNWLILLIGVSIAFYRQHPELVATGLRQVYFSPALSTHYALSLLARIGERFYGARPPYTLAMLAAEYQMPSHVLEQILELLVSVGILAQTDEAEPAYIPVVPLETTRVADVLQRIDTFQPAQTYAPPIVAQTNLSTIEQAARDGRTEALAGMTLKALAMGKGHDTGPDKQP